MVWATIIGVVVVVLVVIGVLVLTGRLPMSRSHADDPRLPDEEPPPATPP